MQIGAVFPHNEIGTDPGAIKAYAQGVEAMGITHLLIYDHVLGADPDREGGFRGPYDKDVAFHEPFTTFAFIAGVTDKIDLITTVMILPQRQTVLAAKQAAEVALLSNNRFKLGIGVGWNELEYVGLNETFNNRGRRQEEQVDVMRKLWSEDSLDYTGEYHRIDKASINPRPSKTIPIWFGGSAPALLDRVARLGDGWIPLMGANDKAKACIDTIKQTRKAAGLSFANFGIQAQAQYAGGSPERWRKHAEAWREMGCTHLAIATHNAGPTNVDGHLARIGEYQQALQG
ncbi:MAG: LLM class F420-dependent oxidoreductase [Pseudomonadota bacterium]|nr:LLM class F420-dependent oxidoreductase [Pseudomonadota bacterium]MEC7251687.1 LLM class F420-dependent oxidoreductase [Pseudomonadota bacterium]MEC7419699.1 LLM class F420-dependent oxidoreductase [Pseudomonadota bacterium]MEC8071897.1 LLM class F420-dependent oxidoreductase [Pseudomonadota bacterium]MEC8500812.1 LLM class F420-dependent oxidoreductase [Pseudomonadota bacterium]